MDGIVAVVKNTLHLQRIIDVRLFLKVALLSDIVALDGSSFYPWTWSRPLGKQLRNGPIDSPHSQKIGSYGRMLSVWLSMVPLAYIPSTYAPPFLHTSNTN